jgi:hypothetical protein
MAVKSPTAIVEQRVSEIHQLLLAGVRRREILQFASKKQWAISDRAVDEYIARAKEQIRATAEVDRSLELGRAIQRLNDLYRASISNGDHRTALHVQRELSSMLGLSEAAKVNMKCDFGDMNGAMDAWRDSIRAMRRPPPCRSTSDDGLVS